MGKLLIKGNKEFIKKRGKRNGKNTKRIFQ